jgi:hypothetical protein
MAAFLIVAIAFAAVMPVFAQLPLTLTTTPTLTVVTIAQDDQLMKTGVMWFSALSLSSVSGFATATYPNLYSQFKIIVSYNGVPVTPSSLFCQVIEKDKYEPKTPQGTWETLASNPVDASGWFVCKPRWGKPGVGVLDVYYVGPQTAFHFSDYILNVQVDYAIGRSTVYGSELQDICVLGWPADGAVLYPFTNTATSTTWYFYVDPMLGYKSCEDLVLTEMAAVSVPIAWGPT